MKEGVGGQDLKQAYTLFMFYDYDYYFDLKMKLIHITLCGERELKSRR